MAGTNERTNSADVKLGNERGIVVAIKNDQLYQPIVVDGVMLEIHRMGQPSKLTFTVVIDDAIKFQEGNEVNLFADGKRIFFGYVFTKSRDKDNQIRVTCYDQLRYLKNKFVYIYNGTATSLIKRIADDFMLRVGDLEDTGYAIPNRLEDNNTLFDIIQTALDLTYTNTKKSYILYDDGGKLMLKEATTMKVDTVIDATTAENFEYTSSIDGKTYNSVQLYYEDGKGKKVRHMPAPARDNQHVAEWGLLQYCAKCENPAAIESLQQSYLNAFNRKTRTLRIRGAFGNLDVRGGTMIPVILDLGDIQNKSYLMVDRVVHRFEDGHHSMDLDLIGGDFVGG